MACLRAQTNFITIIRSSPESSKVWLFLFHLSCVVRAVHLDLVHDMTTTKRFVERRGIPRSIFSDNGKAFKCTTNMLQDMLNQHEVLQYLSGNKIRSTFNVWRRPLGGVEY